MNHLEVGSKKQQIKRQYRYAFKQTAGVCLQNTTDYSPFGVILDGRTIERGFYRRGFNGMEKDDEVKGGGNSYTTEFRQYDSRVGRWFSLDPMASFCSSWTPYRFGFDNPTIYKDMNGLFETRKDAREYKKEHDINGKIKRGSGTKYEIRGKSGITYSKGDDSGHNFDRNKNDGVIESITIIGNKKGRPSSNNKTNSHKWLEGVNLSFAFNGLTKPLSSSKNPFEDNIAEQSPFIQEEWRKQRAKSNAFEKIVLGNFIIGSSPIAIGEAVLTAPTVFGISSDLTWKSFAIKAGTSALVQGIVNEGKINLAGVIADGTLGFGSSAIIGSGIEAKYSISEGNIEFNTLGYGISKEKFMFNSAVGFVFGSKSDFLENQLNSAGFNHLMSVGLSSPLYQFSTNALGTVYDEKK